MSAKTPQEAANAEQAEYWTTDPGRKWVDLKEPLDRALAPVSAVLFERAKPRPGERVIDLGCGTGATTLALAEAVGAEGRVVGLDISTLLLAQAAARTPAPLARRIDYIEADAQTYDFGMTRFDLLVSRFGSMFFADPVAAFRNLRRGLRAGARVHLAAWGPLAANPWFAIPRNTAVARLGPAPPAEPTAPGPLAFADTAYVLRILREAGFARPTAEAVAIHLQPPGDVPAVARLALSIGPVARLMKHYEGTPADEAAIGQSLERDFAAFATADGVRVPATLNLFAAVAP